MKRNTLVAILALVALAGCGGVNGPESPDDLTKVNSTLAEGEAIGIETGGGQHWLVTVTEIHENGTAEIEAEKHIFDETGQDKEGSSSLFSFNRSVEVGEMSIIENDFRVVNFEYDEGMVHIGIEDASWIEQEDVDETIEEYT